MREVRNFGGPESGWTTKQFARTLSDAFPDERACAIERPREPAGAWIVGAAAALALALACIVGLGVVGVLR